MKLLSKTDFHKLSGGMCTVIEFDKETNTITYSGCLDHKVVTSENPEYQYYLKLYTNGCAKGHYNNSGIVYYC